MRGVVIPSIDSAYYLASKAFWSDEWELNDNEKVNGALMLGLSLALGAVSISFAGGDDGTTKTQPKKKGKKKKSEAPKSVHRY